MWDEARKFLQRPDASILVNYRSSSLWWACTINDVPLDIIKTLYKISPRQIHYQDKFYRRTALHRALKFSSDDVVDLLLKLAPELISTPDKQGNLPLHFSVRTTHSIVRKLLLMYPSSLNERNVLRLSPSEIFLSHWEPFLDLKITNIRNVLDLNHIQDFGEGLRDFQKTLLLFIEVFSNKVIQDKQECGSCAIFFLSSIKSTYIDKWLPIHEAIKLGPLKIPPIFVQFLAVTMPLELQKIDSQGNTLLHLSVIHSQYNNLTRFLLVMYASMALIPNNDGRIPLNLAIENGINWEDGVLKDILRSAPDTLSLLDPCKKIYPFMISLCSNKSDLEVAYELLKMDPSLIQCK